ncbi:unnamed protein product [Ambrosiozyma monospora]|uniref:Unnamed protein product n=1 Tax=Ambrosiozyma monospora TaxID=43982 RepID=A0ACB5TB89_AMBMO|nr:unnamed protein product [Ambrosiozyma monospora]
MSRNRFYHYGFDKQSKFATLSSVSSSTTTTTTGATNTQDNTNSADNDNDVNMTSDSNTEKPGSNSNGGIQKTNRLTIDDDFDFNFPQKIQNLLKINKNELDKTLNLKYKSSKLIESLRFDDGFISLEDLIQRHRQGNNGSSLGLDIDSGVGVDNGGEIDADGGHSYTNREELTGFVVDAVEE